ncbi:hypothetical protein SAVERM_1841 [Streptomyces avermitilis MA-4680 = NBRC 14893]|uniref:Uncharacterized protein n=1 Tax=Streptomyces avermitilis (strain ATCC 31267 / DSM 46492 / JCM 5070 / NBRC 14893 / NCIMB 12804 / NRRL 8165 / MA-4680) TaxID=227882 RepID=Q82M19_STRAW|nr:hypothetical protein SAVERM_1841 [Streptomyces avermitilis MA-4680 = NBRC 14893]
MYSASRAHPHPRGLVTPGEFHRATSARPVVRVGGSYLDAGTTLLGSLVACAGVLGAAVVAYLGKRGENALNGFSSLTDKLQSERDRLERQVAERDSRIVELSTLHAADQSEIARLRLDVHRLGGAP